MSRYAWLTIGLVATVALILLTGQCAYAAGEWVGQH